MCGARGARGLGPSGLRVSVCRWSDRGLSKDPASQLLRKGTAEPFSVPTTLKAGTLSKSSTKKQPSASRPLHDKDDHGLVFVDLCFAFHHSCHDIRCCDANTEGSQVLSAVHFGETRMRSKNTGSKTEHQPERTHAYPT